MKKFLQFCIFAFMVIPLIDIHAASSVTVHNQEELKNAINDANVNSIILGNDIETTEKINILRPLSIDGNNHTMKYVGTFGTNGNSNNTVWGGIYLLQVYKTEVTIKDIKLTGGNAALLVNGGKVTVDGVLDVSGNGFGGIELGQGEAVQSTAHLILTQNGKILNTTEDANKPTLWVPEDSTSAILEVNGKRLTLEADKYVMLSDINSLMSPIQNPSTGDVITIFKSMLLIGIVLVLVTKKKRRYS